MSPEEIARLRELAAKATPCWPSGWKVVNGNEIRHPAMPPPVAVTYGGILADADAAYIAAACNALPGLLDVVANLPDVEQMASDLHAAQDDLDAARARIARLEDALREIVAKIETRESSGEWIYGVVNEAWIIARAALATEGGG